MGRANSKLVARAIKHNNENFAMDVSVENSLGLVVGSGTIVNGTGYVSAFSAPFVPGDTVVVENGFDYSSQATGIVTAQSTAINVSMVLDPNAPQGTRKTKFRFFKSFELVIIRDINIM